MRFIYFLLTLPFYFLARIFLYFNIGNFSLDIRKCRENLNAINFKLDDEILEILFLAEDHRIKLHYGVDQYAMLRAIYVTNFKKEFQGASTVAQQYVRVITNKYERTLIRKLREQLLAVLISYEFDNKTIGVAYLNIAFLGSSMNGINGYLRRKNRLFYELDVLEKIKIVSRLKYPEPLKDKLIWSYKMRIRVGNIQSKIVKK